MPTNDQNTEAAVDNQETEQVASIKLDDVTGGWGWYGPGPGYGAPWGGPPAFYGGPGAYNPYAADRRAAWYAAHTPPPARYAGWWY